MKIQRKYGSAIGDYLAKRRMEIAQAEAGEKATAQDVETLAAALADELCQTAKITAEDYVAVEGGTRMPTPEECAAFATVLAKHGLDVTAEELTGLLESADAEAETMTAEAHAAELAAVKAESDAAAAKAAVEHAAQVAALTTETAELRAKLAEAESSITAMASLVAAGQKYRNERAITLRKRVAMRHGGDVSKVPAATLAKLDAASVEELEVLAGFLGDDPLVTPMCAKCGKESAAEYRSSEEQVNADSSPKSRAPRKRDVETTYEAVKRLKELSLKGGIPLTSAEAADKLKAMPDQEFFALLDE